MLMAKVQIDEDCIVEQRNINLRCATYISCKDSDSLFFFCLFTVSSGIDGYFFVFRITCLQGRIILKT